MVRFWKEVDTNANTQSKILFPLIPKVYQFTDRDRSEISALTLWKMCDLGEILNLTIS